MRNLETGGVGVTTLSAPRKVLAVFLSIVLAFGLSPFAKVNRAHAEEVKAASFTTQEKVTDASNAEASVTSGETTEYYDTLASAISAAKENDTVTLLKDVTLEGEGTEDNPVLSIDKAITLTSEDKAITLKTTTTGNLGVGVKVSASATFKGVKFYRSGGSATQSGNKTFYAMLVTSGSYDVTLDGATIDLKYDGTDNAYRTGLYSRTNGKLTIKGQSYINAKYAINIAGTNGTASLEASTASAGWSVLSFHGVNNKVTVDHCKLTSGNTLNGVSNLYAAIWFRGYQGQGVGNSVTVTNTELSVTAKGGNGADQAITGAYGDASLYESEEAFRAATNHVTLGEGNAVTLSSEGSSGAKAIFEYSDIDLKITGGTFNADPRTGAFEYGAYGNDGKQAWSKDTEGSGRNGSKNYVAEGYKITEADSSYKVEAKSDVDVAQEYQKAFDTEYTKDNANHVTWDTLFDAMLTYDKVKSDSDDAVTALKSYYEGIKSISLANENIAESSYGKSATYEGRDAGSLENLVNLEEIDLSNTNIADKESMLALGVFADVEGEGESAKVTAHFKNLKSLNVSGNAGVADFGGLQACTSLESLNLSGTGATNMGAFLGFKSLKSLDISKTAMKDFNGFYDSATVQFPALTSLTATGLTIDSITGLVEVANHSGIPANAKWDLSGSTMTEDYGNHVTQLKNAFSGISGGEFKAPIVKVSEPVVKTGLVYNGKVQRGLDYAKGYELSGFVGYDFTAGGNLDGQNAGTYTVTATLQEGYTWLDGSTEAKAFTYTIAEAAVSSTLHSDATAAASAFKTEHYNTHTNGQTFEADEKYYVKAVDGSYADSLESVTIGGTEHKATDTFKLSSGNNATVTFNYFKVKDGDLYVAFPVALFDMLESGAIKVGEVEISYSGTDDGKATVSAVEPHLASNSALTVTSDGSNAYTVTQSALKPSDEYIEIKIDELVNLADKALMITKKVYKNASGVESTSYGFTDSEKARLGNVLGFYVFPYSKTIAPLASDGCSYTSYQAYLLDVGKTASMSFAMKVSSDRFGVTFDSDGGSEVATQKLAYGEKATGPETPKKDGYTFAGWQLGDADYDFSEAVTSDITLKAKWKKEKVPEAVKTLYADAQSAAEAYKTAHYNKYSKDQKIPAGEDLYVKATTDASLPDDLASITVGDQEYKSNATFEMSIGMDAYITGCKYFQVKDGDLYIAIPVVLFEMIDGAKVKADSLELAYDGGKNEAVAVKGVAGEKDEGSVLEARADDTENSYTVYHDASKPATEGVEIELDGLSDDQVMITKKTLLKNADGSQYSANYGFTAPDPSARSGVDRALRFYAFGWNAEKVSSAWSNYHYTYQAYLMGSGKTAALTLNMKVADRYEVSFASEGGSEVAAQQVWSGEKAKKPASDPTKEGYSFIGWYAEGSESAYNFETTVTANITLTAKWEPKTYDVKVAEGITGGTVTTDPADKATYESDVTVTATPDESHYVGKVTYQVGDDEAVEVAKDENGGYSFKMPAGNVTVSAEFTDKAPQNITVPETFDVFVGESDNLGATVDSNEKLAYESSNAEVATVDESGKVSGVQAGTATITVKAAGTETLLAGEKTVAVTVRDVVAKIGDKSYATLADAVKSANDGETVELVADSIETEALAFPAGKAVAVDLKGKKITLPALAVQVKDEANATIKSTGDAKGEILTESFATGSNSLFNVLTNSSVSLENIKLTTNGTALFPQGDAAKVSVKNCDIIAGVYAVGTNSATTDNYNVVIDLQDSTLSATGFNSTDGDDAPLMINVAGTMNVKNCTVSGHRIGVLARAGKVTIADSKIIYSGDGNEVANFDNSQTWRDGNNVYGAAITVGNYGTAAATAYKANADVTLENVTIENSSTRSALAVFDNPGFSATVKVVGDNTKVQGKIENKTANSASSVEVAGGVFADSSVKDVLAKGYGTYANDDNTYKLKVDAASAIVDGTYYKTLQAAAEAAKGEKEIALVGDVAENDAIALTADLTKAIVSYGDFDKAKLNVTVPEGYELKATDDADAKTVAYELKYKVSVAENIDHGKIGPVPEFAVKGEKVKITVEPELGYELDKLTYNDGTNTVDIENGEFEMPAAIVTVTATFKALPGLGDAVVAPLVDHADGKETPLTETGLKIDSQTYDPDERISTVKLSSTALPKHVNSAGTAGYWVGIGIPVGTADGLDGYTVATGYGTYNDETAEFTSSRDSWDGEHSTFYFGTGKDGEYLDNPAAYRELGAYVALKDENGLDSIYQLDLTVLRFQSDIEYATAKGGKVTGAEHAVDGDVVSLTVEPESDVWTFAGLTVKDAQGGVATSAENKFTMPASKATVTPVFRADLSNAVVTLKQNTVTWSADTTFTPEIVTVKVGDYTLTEGEDYEAKAESGTQVGDYSVTITGKGIYTGEATATLTVEKIAGEIKITPKAGAIERTVSDEQQVIPRAQAFDLSSNSDGKVTFEKAADSVLDVDRDTGDIIIPRGTAPAPSRIAIEVSLEATETHSAAKYKMGDTENVTVNLSWNPASFTQDNVVVTLAQDSVTYDRKSHTPDVQDVTLFGISLLSRNECSYDPPRSRVEAGTDYVVVRSKLTGASDADVVTCPFTVEQRDISDEGAISINPFNEGNKYTYTGAAIEPTAAVNFTSESGVPGNRALVQDEDYTLAYVNNTNVASADDGDKAPTAYFTGVGNFKGSRAVKFTITGADIAEDCTVAHIDAQKRTGARITPDLTITNNESGVVLVPGVDYIAGYANNIAATTADKPANVTITGLGSYANSVAYTSFVITDDLKDLADCSIDAIAPQKQTNTPAVPAVIVKDASGNALTLGTDYTVAYANNDKRGTATVTVTGAGNYAGTLTTTFEIYGLSDMTFDERAKIDIDPVFYTGEKAVPNVKVTLADGTVLQPGEFEVEVDGDAIEPNGEDESYSATVKPVEEAGVKGNSRQVTFEIKPANLNTCTVTGINDVKYTGAEIPLNPIVTNAIGKELNPETDYLVVPASDDDDFKSVGAHRALIAGTGEHYTGATVVTFNIEATNFVDAGVEPVIDGDTSWTGSAVTPVVVKAGEVTLKSGVDYTVRYIGDNKNIGSVKYTVIGYGAFEGSVLSGTFEITRAPIAEPTAVSGLVYSGKVLTGVKAGSGYTVTGNTATNAGNYEATVTPDEHHAWKDGTYAAKTIPWSIAKAPQTITLGKNAKTGKYAYNKTIAMGATSSSGNTVVYSTSNAKVATVSTTGSVKVVKGSGTAKITAKVAGNDNYEEATASITVTATKAANPLKLQAATASGKNTKAQSFDLTKKNAKTKGGIIKTAGAGTVTYTKVKVTDNKNKAVSKALGNKFTVKSGKLTVAKGTKKGTYKVTVKAVAAGNGNYNKSATNLTAVVTVKVS